MSFPVEGDIIQVRFAVSLGEKRCFIIRHYEVALLVGSVSLEDMCFNIDLAISPGLVQLVSPITVWEGVYARNLTSPPGEPDEHTNAVFILPIEALGILPPQVAVLINLSPGYKGLRSRGRVFIPFIPLEGFDPNSGQMTAAYLATAQTTADTLKALVNIFGLSGSCSMVPCIWHRDTLTASRVIDATVSAKWATQRRRGWLWGADED